MPKVVAFVPARCGSKSIRLKNIKPIHGQPLIYWCLKALSESSNVDEIWVSTDCNEISNVVEQLSLKKVLVYMRNELNAGDRSSTESAMIEFIKAKNLAENDLFMLVQATSPFTQANHFNEAIEMITNPKRQSIISVVPNKRFFWDGAGQPINYNYQDRPRRQDFNNQFMENGAFYINSVKKILKKNNRLGGEILLYKMPEYTGVEIDEPLDWKIAEVILRDMYPAKPIVTSKIKLFLSDIDGVMTDAGMYYSENGDEIKKFSTYDGKAFELIRSSGIKTGIVTSEDRNLNQRRAEKIKVDYLYQGVKNKLSLVKDLCKQEGYSLDQVAYIGDDINCKPLLENVGIAACPANAISSVKAIPSIIQLTKKGGEGVVREFAELILSSYSVTE